MHQWDLPPTTSSKMLSPTLLSFGNGVPFRGYRCTVQRDNQMLPMMCDNNPLVSVHDVGAGGLSNAMHELVHGGI